jgi:hypothetical protein
MKFVYRPGTNHAYVRPTRKLFHRELSHDTMIFMRRTYYFPGFDKHDFRLMLPAWRKTNQAESTYNIIRVLITNLTHFFNVFLLETCREVKINTLKNCAKLVITKNCTEMHGQQNIKHNLLRRPTELCFRGEQLSSYSRVS